MMEMKQVTHIVPVGIKKNDILDGLKQHLIHKAVLLIGEENKKCDEVARELESALHGFADVEKVNVRTNDVFDLALTLVDVIERETKKNREVMLNISCSSGNTGVACYLASLSTNSKIYTTITDPANGKIVRVQEIPLFPKKDIPAEQVDILNHLNDAGVDSLDELIMRIKPRLKKNTSAFNNERARICHHIKALKSTNLIETEKVGKNLRISLNPIGRLYLKGEK